MKLITDHLRDTLLFLNEGELLLNLPDKGWNYLPELRLAPRTLLGGEGGVNYILLSQIDIFARTAPIGQALRENLPL